MRKNNKKEVWTNFWKWSFICNSIGLVVCGLCLLFFSVVVFFFMNVINNIEIFSVISLVVGAYISGYLCGLFRRTQGLSEGCINGIFLYIIILIFGGITLDDFFKVLSLTKLILCVVPSMIGAIVGVNHKRPKNI